MQTVNIHEAKTHFSRLVDQVASGEEILIARAGKPVARLVPLASPPTQPRALGAGKGRFTLPEDFSSLHEEAIRRMFETGE
ncbi:MAG: prevent-host-death family protein [bacterium]|nr:MAG: prevent-host-death family protein [bacterium]KAF0148275.1 MAG: prevent-host-death family protein [bacterium]KAF0167771.1 MAG: prevent-host-death family protein [bacterium]TXT20100.1 MAG: prevent-host-death family protein [bacterium]